jgi:general secretion pathway protein A
MRENYRVLFGFKKEPFSQDIRVEDMMRSSNLMGVKERFLYAVNLGAIAVITGDVGSGKSSALRFASATLHPSEYRVLYVTATSGTIAELYKQICHALNTEVKSSSKANLIRVIKSCIMELVNKKEKPVLIIDEASLIRLDVFSELHTLVQFEGDSKSILPVVLAGQNNLMDSLMFRQSRPLASRVVARGHMESLNAEDMAAYLQHHQNIAGCKNLFSEQAVTAIHQGSGGLLRRANNLARGALVAAASEKCMTVSADHVRVASTEII